MPSEPRCAIRRKIELPYNKFKVYWRKLAARTVPSLHRAIRSFLQILKPRNAPIITNMQAMLPYDRNPL